ncbi:MAG: cytochrome c-type biogenesis protein [Pseudomonadales bacterium]
MSDLRRGRSALLLGLLLSCAVARGAGPVDVFQFDSAEQEARYQALVAEFRCPKCLNTNLAGSDAPIAEDLRRTVYRLLTRDGLSDKEIRAFMQERYGDFVLYDPPFRPGTWLLWLGPPAFLLVGLLVLWRLLRQPPREPLSSDEAARLQQILAEEGAAGPSGSGPGGTQP